jgi:hypothetical protein
MVGGRSSRRRTGGHQGEIGRRELPLSSVGVLENSFQKLALANTISQA